VLSARREDELQRVADECARQGSAPDHPMVLPLDVTQTDTLPPATDQVLERFGRIDLLINNAGISQRSLCKDTELSVYQKLMDVDVMGPDRTDQSSTAPHA